MFLTPSIPRGFTLLEVLITLIILAVGMLGLANLQSKIQVTQIESYQRAQAVLLLQDMVNRINANRAQAASYVTASAIGTGDSSPTNCALAATAAQDLCEWSNALKGSSEKKGAANTGSMIDGRGCVTQIQASNPTPGVCTPGIYRISVAWQGLNATVSPPLTCAQGSYGTDDRLRRIVAQRTVISLPGC